MTPLRDLSEAERARRVGNLYHQKGGWCVKIGGKWRGLGKDKKAARAKWEALMLEFGHGFAPGPNFFWNAIEQQWDKGESSSRTSLKYGTLKGRREARSKLIDEKRRLLGEIAALQGKLEQECRARRAVCDKLIREQRIAYQEKMKAWRIAYRASLPAKEREGFDANRARIRLRVNRKRMLRVEELQRISRPWKDKESGLWFSWIGAEHRKLVRLGDDEAKARVVWWVLKGALNEGAKTLRKPEGIQRTIDELLDISPERVAATLQQLGWTVERPAAASNESESYRASGTPSVDRPQNALSRPVPSE